MSVLTGPEIESIVKRTRAGAEAARERGSNGPHFLPRLDIVPFDPARCGPNSYDVTLADKLLVYKILPRWEFAIDTGDELWTPYLDPDGFNPVGEITIPPGGSVLLPDKLYLGSTVEHTECHGLVPWLDGRSSLGRLGVQIHATAGRGDDGFCGTWTLEITVTHPILVRPGMRIGQLTFFTTTGERRPYAGRYAGQSGPVASRFADKPKE